jgi:hypothetical protein
MTETPTASPALTVPPLRTSIVSASPNSGPDLGTTTSSGSVPILTLAVAGAATVIVIAGIVLFLVFCRRTEATSTGLVENDGLEATTDPSWGAASLTEDLAVHQYDNPLTETIAGGEDTLYGGDDE